MAAPTVPRPNQVTAVFPDAVPLAFDPQPKESLGELAPRIRKVAKFLDFSPAGPAPRLVDFQQAPTSGATRRALLTGLALLVTAPTLPNPAHAAANDDAVAFMRDLLTRANGALDDKVPLAARQERFRQMFQADFDGPRIARLVLGPYWRRATADEQQQFIKLFANYVVLVYSKRLADFRGETFKVRGSRADDDMVIVSTDIFTPGRSAPVTLDWRLVATGDGFKIADVVVGGVSMLVTERSEFASVIRRNGGEVGGLLKLMRAKTAGGPVIDQ